MDISSLSFTPGKFDFYVNSLFSPMDHLLDKDLAAVIRFITGFLPPNHNEARQCTSQLRSLAMNPRYKRFR
jgi:hypothetical protein